MSHPVGRSHLLSLALLCALHVAPSHALSTPSPSRPRVVFTDCDGTMLQPDHTLSPKAAKMLNTLVEKGVRVVPATGRARAGAWTDAVLNAHAVLHRGNPGVYINGCSAFDEHGTALAPTYLPTDVVERVSKWFETSDATSDAGLVSYVGGEALYNQGPAALYKRIAALGDSPPRKVAQMPTTDVFKQILLCDDDEHAQKLKPLLLQAIAGGDLDSSGDGDGSGADVGGQLTQALPGYIEVVPSGATKATACSALLKQWGCSWAEVVAIGDGSNDVPMLEAANQGGGTSIAMGNAGDGVKAIAQHVVAANDEEGWVEAMEKFVLARL